jgi:hypothetical protein
MKIDPYVRPDLEATQKSFSETLATLVRLMVQHPQVLRGFLKLRRYAKQQGISFSQALDEALMELPRPAHHIPEAFHDLSNWVRLCELAGIPVVPVNRGPKVSMAVLEATASETQLAVMKNQELPTPHASIQEAARWCEEEYQKGFMWRWECCGPEVLKLLAGVRKVESCVQADDASIDVPVPNTLPHIPFHLDDRLFRIAWDEKRMDVGLISRPWMPALLHLGFPVEFRVFKLKDGYAASNYYPQRPLAKAYLPLMEKAVELTRKLVAFQPVEGDIPSVPESFSCDWVVGEDGKLYFLEGGPPFTPRGGAFPGCFSVMGRHAGPRAGARVLDNEPGAIFFIDPKRQRVIDEYKSGRGEFMAVARRAKIDPRHLAAILAVQGFIPREAFAQVIKGIPH